MSLQLPSLSFTEKAFLPSKRNFLFTTPDDLTWWNNTTRIVTASSSFGLRCDGSRNHRIRIAGYVQAPGERHCDLRLTFEVINHKRRASPTIFSLESFKVRSSTHSTLSRDDCLFLNLVLHWIRQVSDYSSPIISQVLNQRLIRETIDPFSPELHFLAPDLSRS